MTSSLRDLLDADWARLTAQTGAPSTRRLRSTFNPRFLPVVLIRLAHACEKRGLGRVAKLLALSNFVLFGLEVPTRAEIGPGLTIMHTQGIVLGAAVIGRNVTIFQQVTLGAREADFGYDLRQRPVVGDNVTITAGAKVLGPVNIGAGALIAANAVVVKDVPADHVAMGVPAVARPKKPGDNESLD